MDVEITKKEDKEASPIIGVYDVRLKVGDGVRFGFGFGLGIIMWVAIFTIISILGIGVFVKSMLNPSTGSVYQTSQSNPMQSLFK
jgi:hypothetical protein